jgi:hypothetical protein
MELSATPQIRTEKIVTVDAENETLVYDLDANKAHCLNDSAGFIWRNCDGTKTAAEIQALVSAKYGADVPEDYVWLALSQLKESNLLMQDSAESIKKINRREVIKRVGMASVIALPLIASIVAPKNAYASTSCHCVNPGTTTVVNSPDCTTQIPACQPNCNASGNCV